MELIFLLIPTHMIFLVGTILRKSRIFVGPDPCLRLKPLIVELSVNSYAEKCFSLRNFVMRSLLRVRIIRMLTARYCFVIYVRLYVCPSVRFMLWYCF